MEKNGILLERFPIGSQKATKVKKKKKNLKKANHQTFCVSHNELWSFAFRPQLVAANRNKAIKGKKKESDERFECCCYSCFFYVAASLFFWVAVGSTRLGLRFTTVATGVSFADRGGILTEIHFGSFASSHPTATVTNVFSTFDSPWTVNFIRLWPSVQMISNFSNFGAEFLWKFVELNFVKIRKSCRNCRIS